MCGAFGVECPLCTKETALPVFPATITATAKSWGGAVRIGISPLFVYAPSNVYEPSIFSVTDRESRLALVAPLPKYLAGKVNDIWVGIFLPSHACCCRDPSEPMTNTSMRLGPHETAAGAENGKRLPNYTNRSKFGHPMLSVAEIHQFQL